MQQFGNYLIGIRGVFFDLDNTLIDRNAAFERYLTQWLRDNAPTLPESRYTHEIQQIMNKDNWGYCDRSDFCHWLKAAYGLHQRDEEDMLQEILQHIPLQLKPVPALLGGLAQLKEEYCLGIISNGSGHSQRAKMRQTALDTIFLNENVIIEGEIGFAKPHPVVFQRAVWVSNLQPEEILFVGDDPANDILGASQAGMKTCWVSYGRTFPRLAIRPHFTVGHIFELLQNLTNA
jgi:putative hydrolase of the HAD superfamily